MASVELKSSLHLTPCLKYKYTQTVLPCLFLLLTNVNSLVFLFIELSLNYSNLTMYPQGDGGSVPGICLVGCPADVLPSVLLGHSIHLQGAGLGGLDTWPSDQKGRHKKEGGGGRGGHVWIEGWREGRARIRDVVWIK